MVIDTPPLGSVIDAAVAAKNCDGVVMVIENNAISYKFVQRVKDQLDKADTRILGVVLNKVLREILWEIWRGRHREQSKRRAGKAVPG